ncbi:hypothetical protein [Lewinella sp. IMCC34183]|uniref:hypothetical protein n=1 Tax=Lewinella sp. IMCC34183 TaxID=2248762 RepID=UPI000E23BB55|nr:hypothetical protein [Lewinella sp. IMCC34183]
MRIIELDGRCFADLPGFFAEAERLFTRDLSWPVAPNFDALHDILYGGFGVFESGEPVRIDWLHSAKSRADLGYAATEAYWAEKVETFHPKQRYRAVAHLDAARRGEGQTLYGLIRSIILDHPNLTLVEQ